MGDFRFEGNILADGIPVAIKQECHQQAGYSAIANCHIAGIAEGLHSASCFIWRKRRKENKAVSLYGFTSMLDYFFQKEFLVKGTPFGSLLYPDSFELLQRIAASFGRRINNFQQICQLFNILIFVVFSQLFI